MAGKHLGDHQVRIYKKLRAKLSQEAAAAKVGFSTRSARRIDVVEALTKLFTERVSSFEG